MGEFSSDWLSLREPFDNAARDPALASRFAEELQTRRPGLIIDLGAGSGSTTRALASLLPRDQPWLLVDYDPDLLATLPDRLPKDTSMDARRWDLVQDLENLPFHEASAVTCSALLDLVSASWLNRLIDILLRFQLPLYAALTYDGRTEWNPPVTQDGIIVERFNRHMQTDKGFGPALGGLAATRAAELLASHRYRVSQAATPWRCSPEDGVMQQEMIQGYLNAAQQIAPEQTDQCRTWHQARSDALQNGNSRLLIGHIDLLALPPK